MLKGKDYAEYSDIPELKMPKINGSIPDELMQNLSPEMKHLFSEQSKQTQLLTWCAQALIDTNRQVRITNGRVKKVEEWKNKLTNSWAFGLFCLVMTSTVITLSSKIMNLISGG